MRLVAVRRPRLLLVLVGSWLWRVRPLVARGPRLLRLLVVSSPRLVPRAGVSGLCPGPRAGVRGRRLVGPRCVRVRSVPRLMACWLAASLVGRRVARPWELAGSERAVGCASMLLAAPAGPTSELAHWWALATRISASRARLDGRRAATRWALGCGSSRGVLGCRISFRIGCVLSGRGRVGASWLAPGSAACRAPLRAVWRPVDVGRTPSRLAGRQVASRVEPACEVRVANGLRPSGFAGRASA